MANTVRTSTIGKVSVPKASEVLASDLRRRILGGEFIAGDMLPTERDLVDLTELSRATVREALRMLEVQGLIVTRPGRGGGSMVRELDVSGASDVLEMLIEGRKITMGNVLEAREAIEPLCAQLAAERRDNEDLAELRRLNDAMRASLHSDERFLAVNLDWHLAVAHASHNDLLEAIMRAISRAIHAATELPGLDSDVVRNETLLAHEKITASIAAQSSAAARRRMGGHVHEFADVLVELDPTSTKLPVR
jgi:DNA-binding FadR family transcriptional regulator